MKNNFLISTGGSGGHVIPATILYEHLSKHSNVILSIDKRGMKYLDKNNYQFEIIDTPKLNNIFFLPLNIIKIFILTFKSFFLLKRKKIVKIFSTGGYMSLPLILASKFLKIKIYLIEPNLVIGRSNKFFLESCKKIFCYSDKIKNFPEKYKNKMVVINPLVKQHIYGLMLQNNNEEITLLVIGGSQGANIFDNKLKNSIINISKKFPIKVIQQTSEKNISSLSNFYFKNNIKNKIFSFENNLANLIQKADICITRGGASTLAELSIMNVPFIVVPLPTSKDNHQFENANYYRENDCCWILNQDSFEEKVEEFLESILNDKSNFHRKKDNLKKLNYKNTWINVNHQILKIINEN